VTEFRAADKYEDFTTAVSALDGALGLARPGSTRILVIVSDGRYKGSQHADGQKLITRLAASGCLVIWIVPSDTAKTMTGARVVILADPAATSAAIARARVDRRGCALGPGTGLRAGLLAHAVGQRDRAPSVRPGCGKQGIHSVPDPAVALRACTAAYITRRDRCLKPR
jgi:hypothetical protein